jgi:redox-sensitive bicupin YhaK (pirin superfamily)
VTKNATGPASFILVAGENLHQNIFQQNPFFETSFERIIEKFTDYCSYQNGFERAHGWTSKIGKRFRI